jgi:hypothetical protein
MPAYRPYSSCLVRLLQYKLAGLCCTQGGQHRLHSSLQRLLATLHVCLLQLAAGSVHTHPLEPRSAGKCPGEAIVDFVDRAGVDMVVIGSRGLEGWRR